MFDGTNISMKVNRENIRKDSGLLFTTDSFQDLPYKNEIKKKNIIVPTNVKSEANQGKQVCHWLKPGIP